MGRNLISFDAERKGTVRDSMGKEHLSDQEGGECHIRRNGARGRYVGERHKQKKGKVEKPGTLARPKSLLKLRHCSRISRPQQNRIHRFREKREDIGRRKESTGHYAVLQAAKKRSKKKKVKFKIYRTPKGKDKMECWGRTMARTFLEVGAPWAIISGDCGKMGKEGAKKSCLVRRLKRGAAMQVSARETPALKLTSQV